MGAREGGERKAGSLDNQRAGHDLFSTDVFDGCFLGRIFYSDACLKSIPRSMRAVVSELSMHAW